MYIGDNLLLRKKLEEPDASKADLTSSEEDTRTLPPISSFILLTDHHFEADITFPREGNGNKSVSQTIKIYNPAPDTEDKIKSGNVLILKAGYNTDEFLPILCATQIIKAQVIKNGTDRIAILTCGEAYNAKRIINYSAGWSAEKTYSQAIEDTLEVFAAYGVPTGRIEWNEDATTKQFGLVYVVTMNLSSSLTSLCEGCGLRWYIAGGEIFIQPKNQKENKYLSVLKVTEENVKETVEFLDDISNKTVGQSTTRTSGVKVRVNLNANVNKADGLQIAGTENSSSTFKQYEGRYLIESVTHSLSYEGDSWDTTVEARG